MPAYEAPRITILCVDILTVDEGVGMEDRCGGGRGFECVNLSVLAESKYQALNMRFKRFRKQNPWIDQQQGYQERWCWMIEPTRAPDVL